MRVLCSAADEEQSMDGGGSSAEMKFVKEKKYMEIPLCGLSLVVAVQMVIYRRNV